MNKPLRNSSVAVDLKSHEAIVTSTCEVGGITALNKIYLFICMVFLIDPRPVGTKYFTLGGLLAHLPLAIKLIPIRDNTVSKL